MIPSVIIIQNDTAYDSEIWTAKDSDQTVFNSQFWSASVYEVCLWSRAFVIPFPVHAPSLRSLFFGKHVLNRTIAEWEGNSTFHMSTPSFTDGCFEAGFNVGDPNVLKVRLGIANKNYTGKYT